MATNDSNLEVRITGVDTLSPALQKLESKVIRFVGSISAAIAGIKLFTAPIQAAAAFERELANVAKTTDFVSKAASGGIGDLDRMGDALLRMSLNVGTSAVDLAKIAAAAGQQGLGRFGVEGVIAFTDSVSRMANVLEITADDAANAMGKIVNIFKIPLAQVEKAVSVINEVSNKSTASGAELLDVIKRIGDAAGSLDLSQVTALSAAALDLGTSPEVAGTAFARMFSAATEKADEFGKLMGMSATGWVKKLKDNGLEAFKDFLAKLRTLDESSQQKAIVKLVGGGRIGALLNKLVQDTTDSVINRNFEAAKQGEGGTSALREQAHVLGTLTEQTRILHNSFIKLGIDASQELLKPLATYAAQLSAALQTPEMKSFIGTMMAGVKEVIDGFVTVTTTVSNLGKQFDAAGNAIAGTGVNWENLVKVAKAWLGLKLLETVVSLTQSLPGMSLGLKSISKETQELHLTGKAGWLAQKLGFSEALIRGKEYLASLAQQKTAVQSLAIAESARKAAQNVEAAAQTAAGSATNRVARVTNVVDARRTNLQQAEQAAAAATIAAQNAIATRIQQAEAATAAARLQIENDYIAKRNAIRATGTQTGLKAAQAERTALLAAEDAHHARSLQGINNYYGRRAALQQAALDAEVVRQRTALAASEATLLAATTGSTAANAAATAATAVARTAALAAAEAAALVAPRLTLFERAVRGVGLAFTGFGIALRTFAGVAVAAGRLIFSAFLWISILYSIADAFGLLGKATSLWYKLADAIGLSSKASRDAKVAQEEQTKRLKEEREEVERLTKAYKDKVDAQTGRLDQNKVQGLVTSTAQTKDKDLQVKNILDLGATARGNDATQTQAKARANQPLKEQLAEQDRIINANLEARNRLLEEKETAMLRRRNRAGAAGFDPQAAEVTKKAYDDQIANIDALIKKQGEERKALADGTQSAKSNLKGLSEDAVVAQTKIASMFTPETLALANTYATAVAKNAIETRNLETETQDLQKAAQEKGKLDENTAATQLSLIQSKNEETVRLKAKVKELIEEEAKQKGVPKEALDSYRVMSALWTAVEQNAENALAFIRAAGQAPKTALTGENIPGKTQKSSGTDTFDPNEHAKALAAAQRALRKANRDIREEEIDAEVKLLQERARIELEADQRGYDRGILALKDYYRLRRDTEQNEIQAEIDARKRKLEGLIKDEEEARKAPRDSKDPVTAKLNVQIELARIEKERVALNGQIAVLEAKKPAAIAASTAAEKLSAKALQESFADQENSLKVDGIIASDTPDLFKAILDNLLSKNEDFFNTLRTNYGEAGVALVEALKKSLNLQTFTDVLKPLETSIELLQGRLSRERARLDIAHTQGSLTSVETAIAQEEAIKRQLPLMQELLEKAQKALDLLRAKGAEGTPAFDAQAAKIDELKLRYQQMGAEVGKTAQGVNKSLTDTLAGAFDKLTSYGSKARDVMKGFLFDMANMVKKLLLQNLAEQIINGLGSGGAGGFGGFIAGLFDKKKVGPDGSAGNPLNVNIVNGAAAPAAPLSDGATPDSLLSPEELKAKSAAQPQGVLDSFFAKVKEGFDTTTTFIGDSFSKVRDSLVQAFPSLSGVLGGGKDQAPGVPASVGGQVLNAGPNGTTTQTGNGPSIQQIAGIAQVGASMVGLATSTTTAGRVMSAISLVMGIMQLATAATAPTTATMGFAAAFAEGALWNLAAAATAAALAQAGGGAAGDAAVLAMFAHTGGTVGSSGMVHRMMHPALFSGAPRYHGGGIAGLKPGEVPSILMKGEAVLTENQQSLVAAAMDGGGHKGPMNIRNVLVTDPSFVNDHLQSSQGEKVLLNFITKNRSTIKQAIS